PVPAIRSSGAEFPPEVRHRGRSVRGVALTIGSCAAPAREPRQIRKEAAVSGSRRVPQASLIRAARVGVPEMSAIDGGCTAFPSLDGWEMRLWESLAISQLPTMTT